MSDVVSTYGRLLIGVLVTTAILALLLATPYGSSLGVTAWIGQRAQPVMTRAAQSHAKDTTVFDRTRSRPAPSVAPARKAVAGTPVALLSLMDITDADGWHWDDTVSNQARVHDNTQAGVRVWTESELRGMWVSGSASRPGIVRVLGIVRATDQTALTGSYDPATGMVTFAEPGVVRVRLRVMDASNTSVTVNVEIPVDLGATS